MKGDRFKIVDKDGRLVGYGFGATQLAAGETRVDLDTEAQMLAEPDVERDVRVTMATHTVCACKSEDRTQALGMKAHCARLFLANVPDTGLSGNSTVIDPVLYRMLWLEYDTTQQHLGGMSPWDLARKIDEKAAEIEDMEIARRIAILDAEKTLIEEGET